MTTLNKENLSPAAFIGVRSRRPCTLFLCPGYR